MRVVLACVVLIGVVLIGVVLIGAPLHSTFAPAGDPSSRDRPASTTASDGAAPTIISQLDALPVKGRAPRTGYSRTRFGQRWSDDVSVPYGHNGCDTRNDILRRDLTHVVLDPASHGCVVLSGMRSDPYTGRMIAFVRGASTSARIQIDHVVALSDAWQKGAQLWTADKRRDFANDPRNLLAVDGPANVRKGDGDAATWLPPNKSYRCSYVSTQVNVKTRYGLWVTAAEKSAMRTVLASCR
ncbi:MAG: HNH endonuclease family protein [Gordonia sp. (in: high G+C Gram-positive bacteria)]